VTLTLSKLVASACAEVDVLTAARFYSRPDAPPGMQTILTPPVVALLGKGEVGTA
jgi:hypothetical protein